MAWAPTERTEATVSPREAEKRRSNRERSSPFVSPLLRFSVCYRCLRVHRSLTPASWNSAVASAASSRSPPPDATSAFTRGVPHVYGIEPPGADAGRAPAEIQPKSRVFGLGCTNRECSPRELLASDFVGVGRNRSVQGTPPPHSDLKPVSNGTCNQSSNGPIPLPGSPDYPITRFRFIAFPLSSRTPAPARPPCADRKPPPAVRRRREIRRGSDSKRSDPSGGRRRPDRSAPPRRGWRRRRDRGRSSRNRRSRARRQ